MARGEGIGGEAEVKWRKRSGAGAGGRKGRWRSRSIICGGEEEKGEERTGVGEFIVARGEEGKGKLGGTK